MPSAGCEPWSFRLKGWISSTGTLDDEMLVTAVELAAEDIHAWLVENMEGWEIAATEIRSDDLEACWSQVYFRFADKTDAAMFWLRWGGDERLES